MTEIADRASSRSAAPASPASGETNPNRRANAGSSAAILKAPQPPAECVAQTGSITDYEPSRAVALGPGQNLSSAELQVLSRLKSVPNISPANLLCDASGCPLELHGSLLYVDNNHLTYAATQLLEPQVAVLLRSLTSAHQ